MRAKRIFADKSMHRQPPRRAVRFTPARTRPSKTSKSRALRGRAHTYTYGCLFLGLVCRSNAFYFSMCSGVATGFWLSGALRFLSCPDTARNALHRYMSPS
ncbi:uncharacterized protein NEMAJ01_0363 [Nematocida major]|uniref:uncharacterized protein n=1 Tax=Nematocida major TaxID=1912982 RepID=UPI0020083183|nr:uncharacterized protein NEMAJ01_0363 [Nematocida major]KAH9385467.1 hypothetical protein NEMAJ01_0363 [Nematocida major]